ncbi:6-phosphogluconolactonase protein [Dioscorea alata]|uniref:6-phosphogluconolactonase protein n=1 Tax=Dioscorea alata TaxID=55571 RepID=A0ACB7UWC4_DIOAL|nr:6-phosphogluconolactonase protein [Dioscorea alata]
MHSIVLGINNLRSMAVSGDPKSRGELRSFDNSDELATNLAEYIAQLSDISVKDRGVFTIALSGGCLINLMGKLCEAPYSKTVDWTKWYVFWADERAVSKNHVDSNYKLAKDGFLSKVPVLNSHIYSINDNATTEDAAEEYEFTIRQLVKVRTVDVSAISDCPKFDLILLCVGEDGHIASLFPGHPALEDKDNWVTFITDSPVPPPERITFTLPVINSASNVALVVAGEENKANALSIIFSDDNDDIDALSLPAQMVRPTDGELVWFVAKGISSEPDGSNSGHGCPP